MLQLTVCASSTQTPRTRRNFSSRCVSSYHHHQNHVLCLSPIRPLLIKRSRSTWSVSSTHKRNGYCANDFPTITTCLLKLITDSSNVYLTTNNMCYCSTLWYLTKWISVIIYITTTTTDNWWENPRTLITLLSSFKCYSRTRYWRFYLPSFTCMLTRCDIVNVLYTRIIL